MLPLAMDDYGLWLMEIGLVNIASVEAKTSKLPKTIGLTVGYFTDLEALYIEANWLENNLIISYGMDYSANWLRIMMLV